MVFPIIAFARENNNEKKLKKKWLRTDHDAIVYLPKGENDGDNEDFLVCEAPLSDELFAIWTQSNVEDRGDNRAVLARSKNGKNGLNLLVSEVYINSC